MPVKREPSEPQGFIKPNGVRIPALQDGEEVNCIDAVMEMIAPFWNLIERTSALVGIGVHWRWAIYIAAATLLVEDTLRIMRRP